MARRSVLWSACLRYPPERNWEYAISFKNVLEMYGVSIEELDGGIISFGSLLR